LIVGDLVLNVGRAMLFGVKYAQCTFQLKPTIQGADMKGCRGCRGRAQCMTCHRECNLRQRIRAASSRTLVGDLTSVPCCQKSPSLRYYAAEVQTARNAPTPKLGHSLLRLPTTSPIISSIIIVHPHQVLADHHYAITPHVSVV